MIGQGHLCRLCEVSSHSRQSLVLLASRQPVRCGASPDNRRSHRSRLSRSYFWRDASSTAGQSHDIGLRAKEPAGGFQGRNVVIGQDWRPISRARRDASSYHPDSTRRDRPHCRGETLQSRYLPEAQPHAAVQRENPRYECLGPPYDQSALDHQSSRKKERSEAAICRPDTRSCDR